MILQGNLKDFSLPDVLQLLLQQKKSGVLALSDGKRQSEMFISQGSIAGVRIGSATPETKIRDMLVESGKVSRGDMRDFETVSRNMNRPLLATLIAKSLLDEEEKEEWFQMAAEDMVCDLFSWAEGNYSFSSSQKGIPESLGALRLSTDFACMEGMRRIDEWPTRAARIGEGDPTFQATGKPFDADPDDWAAVILSRIDGRKPLSQLEKEVPFGSFRLAECIITLWDEGCIQPIAGQPAASRESATPSTASDKERKTAVLLGLVGIGFVCALGIRIMGLWMQSHSSLSEMGALERIQTESIRRNAGSLALEWTSNTGSFPQSLEELVESGMLTPFEIHSPVESGVRYKPNGTQDALLP
jgi:hypothetical protein